MPLASKLADDLRLHRERFEQPVDAVDVVHQVLAFERKQLPRSLDLRVVGRSRILANLVDGIRFLGALKIVDLKALHGLVGKSLVCLVVEVVVVQHFDSEFEFIS